MATWNPSPVGSAQGTVYGGAQRIEAGALGSVADQWVWADVNAVNNYGVACVPGNRGEATNEGQPGNGGWPAPPADFGFATSVTVTWNVKQYGSGDDEVWAAFLIVDANNVPLVWWQNASSQYAVGLLNVRNGSIVNASYGPGTGHGGGSFGATYSLATAVGATESTDSLVTTNLRIDTTADASQWTGARLLYFLGHSANMGAEDMTLYVDLLQFSIEYTPTGPVIPSFDATLQWGFSESATNDSVREVSLAPLQWGHTETATSGAVRDTSLTALQWGHAETTTSSKVASTSPTALQWGFTTSSTSDQIIPPREVDLDPLQWGHAETVTTDSARAPPLATLQWGFSESAADDSVRDVSLAPLQWGWSTSISLDNSVTMSFTTSWGFDTQISNDSVRPSGPSAITDLAATPGDAEVALAWSAPADGGSPITDYVVEYRALDGAYVGGTVAQENALTGNALPQITGYGDTSNQGFARPTSVNTDELVEFCVTGDCEQIDIYRIGHYGGTGARLITTLTNTATAQPAATTIANSNGGVECQNWSATASWRIPGDAVSGLYIAHVRNAALTDGSWIAFCVRNDSRTADIVVGIPFSTWGCAYNWYGGKNLYGSGAGVGSIGDRTYAVSLERPINSRGDVVNHWDDYDLAAIDYLEEQGFDVKYVFSHDLETPARFNDAAIYMSVGHDEYWSEAMYDAVEAFRDAGGHSIWLSGNDVFWKVRFEDNYRTMWCIASGQDVTTDRGPVKIEDVQTTDRVLTRDGWKAVQHRTFMGIKDCIRLTMDDGSTLVCTADHRIAIPGGGWAEAGTLATGSSVVALPTAPPLGTGAVSTGSSTSSDHRVRGRHLMPVGAVGPVQVLPLADVVDGVPSEFQVRRPDAELVAAQVVDRHVAGLGQWADEDLVHDTVGLADGSVPAQVAVVPVGRSGPDPALVGEVDLGADAVGEQVRSVHLHHITAVEHVGFLPVYDIGVEDQHEFVVNGTVVHNCYKDTMNNGVPLDPVEWTGTWRDTRWANRRPENLMHGTTFRLNGINYYDAVIDASAVGTSPLWRDTAVQDGPTDLTLTNAIGFEANSIDVPPTWKRAILGATTYNIDGRRADDNGQTYTNNGDLDWGIIMTQVDDNYGVVVHFASMAWCWALSDAHDGGTAIENAQARQSMANLLYDLGATADTLDGTLTTPTPVTDIVTDYGLAVPVPSEYVWNGADPSYDAGDTNDYELGTRFTVAAGGETISGFRIWSGGLVNIPGRVIRLWDSNGTQVNDGTFPFDIPDTFPSAGWNEFSLPSNYTLAAGTYTVSCAHGGSTNEYGFTSFVGYSLGNITYIGGYYNGSPSIYPNLGGSNFYGIDIQVGEVAPPTPTAPDAPTGVSASAGDNQVTINWTDAVTGYPAPTYTIERRIGAGAWSALTSGIATGTETYVDSTAVNGTTYRYRVQATNSEGTSAWVETGDVTPAAPSVVWFEYPGGSTPGSGADTAQYTLGQFYTADVQVEITHVRVWMPAQNTVTNRTLYLTSGPTAAGGSSYYNQAIPDTLDAGWNDIELTTPSTWNADGTVYGILVDVGNGSDSLTYGLLGGAYASTQSDGTWTGLGGGFALAHDTYPTNFNTTDYFIYPGRSVTAFSPLDIAWDAALWADDPGFAAPSDGADIPSDPTDHAGTVWTRRNTTGQTVKWRTDMGGTGKPAFYFPAATGVSGPALEVTPTMGNTTYVFLVGKGYGAGADFCDSTTGTFPGRRLLQKSSGAWMLYMGAVLSGGTNDENVHAFYILFDPGGNDVLDVDGVNVLSGDAGLENFDAGFAVGATDSNTEHTGSEVAFCGIKDSAFTAQEMSDLLAWAAAEYGI